MSFLDNTKKHIGNNMQTKTVSMLLRKPMSSNVLIELKYLLENVTCIVLKKQTKKTKRV